MYGDLLNLVKDFFTKCSIYNIMNNTYESSEYRFKPKRIVFQIDPNDDTLTALAIISVKRKRNGNTKPFLIHFRYNFDKEQVLIYPDTHKSLIQMFLKSILAFFKEG